MNTNKSTEDKDNSRFTVYKTEIEDKWVIEDLQTSVTLTFTKGKVHTDGYFVSVKNKKVVTDTKLIGDSIREMDEFLSTNYKHLHGKTKTKK